MTEQPTSKYPKGVEGLRDALKQAKEDGVFKIPENTFFIQQPKESNYICYMFGGDAGFSPITWTPQEGKVPNAWVRFWMKVFFNCKWVKKDT
jgi:hypothetical protein